MNRSKIALTALLLAVCLLMTACQSAQSLPTEEPTEEITDGTDTTDAPALEPVDLMETAISKSSYAGSGLKSLSCDFKGTGVFKDYLTLHSYPLKCADYAWNVRRLAENIKAGSSGLSDFCISAVSDYGFRYEVTEEYTVYSDVDEALTALFAAGGDSSDLEVAKEQLASVSSEIKPLLARWLSAAAYSYKLIIAEAKTVYPDSIASLLNFYCCYPASSDTALLNTMQTLSSYITMENLIKGELAILKASEELARSLADKSELTVDGAALSISTPMGDIIFGSTENDTYSSPNALLLVEPQGDDTYNGRIAAGYAGDTPISTVIELGGDDIYAADSDDGFTQGAGIFGAGMLFDMQGKDCYTAGRLAQGCCILGMGVLCDFEGDDSYGLEVTGQSAGFYGLAVLSDFSGNDSYNAKGYAQSSAGPRCMAYLIDVEGNDEYFVQPYVEAGFAVLKYDQFPQVNGNWSQGCGWGQRVINLSGGVAGLIDLSGDDIFTGGIWVQGVGYWSGVGFLFNENGNDRYNSCYYSQASVAHYGVGILVDVGGDDVHTVASEKVECGDGASLGFTWDRGTAMFVNDGGNDKYFADQISCGIAWSEYDEKGYKRQDMTYAIFVDTDGDDKYSVDGDRCYGWGRGGFFIDAAGKDEFAYHKKKNNALLYTEALQGGVFYDYSSNYSKTPEPPVIGFWENAKASR